MGILIIILAQLAAPVPPTPAPTLPGAVPSQEIFLTWDNSPTAGCSNLVCWYTQTRELEIVYADGTTNVLMIPADLVQTNVGPTNLVRRLQPVEPRTYYYVRAVKDGVLFDPSNTIGVPPKTVDKVIGQRDGKDIGIVDSWTNQPAAPMATYRLRIERTEDYTP